MRKTEVPGTDYFTVDREVWLRMLAFEQLAPLLAERNVSVAAARDAARDAVDRGLVEVEAGNSGRLHRYDVEAHIFALETSKPWLVRPQTNASEEKPTPQRHPALAGDDPQPGTPTFDKLDSLRKLNIANKIEAYKLAQAKAARAAKGSGS